MFWVQLCHSKTNPKLLTIGGDIWPRFVMPFLFRENHSLSNELCNKHLYGRHLLLYIKVSTLVHPGSWYCIKQHVDDL